MFETLDEQIEKTEDEHPSTRTRAVRYAGVFVVTAVVIGVLYAAIAFLE